MLCLVAHYFTRRVNCPYYYHRHLLVDSAEDRASGRTNPVREGRQQCDPALRS